MMTGPAVGKIPVRVHLDLNGEKLSVEAYIHLKGFARALVTHLDIEGINVGNGKDGVYILLVGIENGFLIICRRPIRINNRRVKKFGVIGINLLKKGERSSGWLGFKEGGFYIGFKREIINRLEEIAQYLAPDLFRKRGLMGFVMKED